MLDDDRPILGNKTNIVQIRKIEKTMPVLIILMSLKTGILFKNFNSNTKRFKKHNKATDGALSRNEQETTNPHQLPFFNHSLFQLPLR